MDGKDILGSHTARDHDVGSGSRCIVFDELSGIQGTVEFRLSWIPKTPISTGWSCPPTGQKTFLSTGDGEWDADRFGSRTTLTLR